MNDKMIVCNWYTPAEKMPEEGHYVAVTYSGHANRITYDHALGIGQWMDDGLGWDIEGLPLSADVEVLAWRDLEPYQGGIG